MLDHEIVKSESQDNINNGASDDKGADGESDKVKHCSHQWMNCQCSEHSVSSYISIIKLQFLQTVLRNI